MNEHLNHTFSLEAIMETTRIPTNVSNINEMLSENLPQERGMIIRSGLESKRKVSIRETVFPPSFLEPLIKEGFPKGSNFSLIGPPGVGKTIFCENLVNNFLRNGGSCLYVTLDKAPDDVRSNFQELRTTLSEKECKKRLVFVDGFSWLIGKSREAYHVENLANLTELSIRVSSAAYDLADPILLIFDSVSPLVVYNPENVVVKFLQLLLARIKDWNGMGVYVVQEGVHSDEFCNTLGYLVDGILDMKMKEEKGKITRYFRIRSLKFMSHETRWIPFVIQTDRKFKLKHKRGRS
jgi:KaiC/GvpD/RAD55 family RecA-like ATPase